MQDLMRSTCLAIVLIRSRKLSIGTTTNYDRWTDGLTSDRYIHLRQTQWHLLSSSTFSICGQHECEKWSFFRRVQQSSLSAVRAYDSTWSTDLLEPYGVLAYVMSTSCDLNHDIGNIHLVVWPSM